MGNGYNGWSNYETWNVKLWIDNDQGSYNYWNERAREAYKAAKPEYGFTRTERATIDLAEWLKDEINENAPEVEGTYADLLGAALSSVDWHEIATALIEDLDLDEDSEEE